MPGILLIHGGWHGPWYWDDFARRLGEFGHEVRAVRLRGHDGPPGRIWCRIEHYLEDVRLAAAEFAEPPVLVGHSMGGLLAQMHAEREPTAGAALLASVPPGGVPGLVARLAARHPAPMLKANVLMRLRPLVGTADLVRDLFFTPDTPQPVVDDLHARLQDESYLAFLDMLTFARPRPQRVRTPVLVIGAERDAIVHIRDVHRTARAYGVQAEILPGVGHHIMFEEGWQHVADRIDAWVRAIVPVPKRDDHCCGNPKGLRRDRT